MKLTFNKEEKDNYTKIISEIKSNLTNDQNKNIKYLTEMCKKYKKHKMSNEIIKEIGRMIFENTSDEYKEKLNKAIFKDVLTHFEKGEKLMQKGDYIKAKKEFEKFIQSEAIVNEDRISIPYTPRNPIEFILCNELNKEKNARDVGIDYSTGYLRLGCIAIEENQVDKAIEYLNKSIKYNPYNASSRFELVEAYKRRGNLEMVKSEIDKTYEFIYLPNDLSRYYRDLGYYYIEMKNFDLAKSLYLYSIQFDNSKKDFVTNELNFIYTKTGNDKIPNINEAYKNIESANIPIFFDKGVIRIVLALYKQIKVDKQEDSPIGELVEDIAKFYLKYIN